MSEETIKEVEIEMVSRGWEQCGLSVSRDLSVSRWCNPTLTRFTGADVFSLTFPEAVEQELRR